MLDKYAVRVGGGLSHRAGLFDMVLLKENHIAAVGSLISALERAQKSRSKHCQLSVPIGVEVGDRQQLEDALKGGADWIMLDNMSVEQAQSAMEAVLDWPHRGGRPVVEASGNIDSGNAARYAHAGVDVISVGALTHSSRAMDLSMKLSA